MSKSAAYKQVYDYWNETVCCSTHARSEALSREYFEEIEAYKYINEPEIHAFAQFSRYHGKEVLEVGVGAGTDFLQWVRAGAIATGVDLTRSGVEHTETRLRHYGLEAHDLRVANCEELPFADGSFDLAYSWGVIHHTPDTEKALSELIRVTRPGGEIKVMVYNRHSLVSFYRWWQMAFSKGKPWKSLAWVLDNHMESQGTKAYTDEEISSMFERNGALVQSVQKYITYYDRKVPGYDWLARVLGPDSAGWFMGVTARKPGGQG